MFSPPTLCCCDFWSWYFHWTSLSKYTAHPGASSQDEGATPLCGPTDHRGGCAAPQRNLELFSQDLWRKTCVSFQWCSLEKVFSRVSLDLCWVSGRWGVWFWRFWWYQGVTTSLLSTITWFGHQQSLGHCKSSQLLRAPKLSFFSNVTTIIVPAVICFFRIHLTPGTWQPPNAFAVLHLQKQKWFWLVLF